jgi:hypothetical protein
MDRSAPVVNCVVAGIGLEGWRVDPPNFLAFRWNGKANQVRRVLEHEVVPNLQERWPRTQVDEDNERPHVIYKLGPPLPMYAPVPVGTNYRDMSRCAHERMFTEPAKFLPSIHRRGYRRSLR